MKPTAPIAAVLIRALLLVGEGDVEADLSDIYNQQLDNASR